LDLVLLTVGTGLVIWIVKLQRKPTRPTFLLQSCGEESIPSISIQLRPFFELLAFSSFLAFSPLVQRQFSPRLLSQSVRSLPCAEDPTSMASTYLQPEIDSIAFAAV
jgi:hypothetical protein